MNQKLLFTLFSIFFITNIFAQTTKIKGQIVDSITREPLSFANVVFLGTRTGAITNDSGYFNIETRKQVDTIEVIAVGYRSVKKKIRRGMYQVLKFELAATKTELEAIIVKPGENPAHKILGKIIARKDLNNPRKREDYKYEAYNKIQLDLNNIDSAFRNKRFLKSYQFIFENLDTNVVTGKVSLPMLISETVSDIYNTNNPKRETEVIKASQISGVRNESVSQFTGQLTRSFNIYDNYMKFQESGFISPINDMGTLFYKYYLIDSATLDGHWCYRISFKPARKQERSFTGDFWVADTLFAIKNITMRLATDANVNWINSLEATYEYTYVNDSLWCPASEFVLVDFNVADSKKIKGFYGRKNAVYSNYKFGLTTVPLEVVEAKQGTVMLDSALEKDINYWRKTRPVNLSEKEEKVYDMVDSVKNLPLYRSIADIVNVLVDFHYDIKWYEFGPYYTVYSNNPIEGNRFRIGGRTNKYFSKHWRIYNYIAYGTVDKRTKYAASLQYLFANKPLRSVFVSYKEDVDQLGQSARAFKIDNFMTTLLRRRPDYKLTLVRNAYIQYEHEWIQGFSNTLGIEGRIIYPTVYIPFTLNNGASLKNISTAEISLKTHYAYNEKFVLGVFDHVSLGTPYPVIDVTVTLGKCKEINANQLYVRTNIQVRQKLPAGIFGNTIYCLNGAQIFGSVPYPLLELHKGNETYIIDRDAFNMMNYYEFVSDRFATITVEQHFMGLFFNRIPLLRKLKLREVAAIKGLVGTLNSENRNTLIFPDGLDNLKKPYFEGAVGIENIFKLFRIDAMWRLSHLNNKNIEKFGFRCTVQVKF